VDPDARLAAGAGGLAHYFADAAGLDREAAAQWQEAAVAACLEAFECLSPEDPPLQITCARFEDRIEIALAHKGDCGPAVGLDVIAGFTAPLTAGASRGLLAGVDRVQYDTRGGEAVTRLTKYIGDRTANT
jgi:hypothetical protein